MVSGVSSNRLLQVICLGQTDGLPDLVWQDAGGTRHYYGQLPCPANTTFASIATGVGNAGQLQVVCIGKTDGLPYLIYQDTGGTRHSYGVLRDPAGTTFAAVATGTGNAGQLQVVCIGRNDGLPYLIYQDTGGTWHSYGALLTAPAEPFVAVATGIGNGGQLQVVCIDRNDGLPQLIWAGYGWNLARRRRVALSESAARRICLRCHRCRQWFATAADSDRQSRRPAISYLSGHGRNLALPRFTAESHAAWFQRASTLWRGDCPRR
jgi:hypothetical protein